MTGHPEPWYIDMDGNPIDVGTWSALFQCFDDRVVASDTVGRTTVITVWSGVVDTSINLKPFGTAFKSADRPVREIATYDTCDEARAGHARIVARLKG